MTDRVSIWPKDEAFRRLLEASLIFKELYGSHNYTTFLQQEIARETVVREYHASAKERVEAEAAAQLAAERLAIAITAFEFYEDPGNYNAPSNGKPSAIARDKGKMARDALAAITGEGNGEEAE